MVIVAVLCALGRIAVAQVSTSEFDVNPSESLFVMGTLTFHSGGDEYARFVLSSGHAAILVAETGHLFGQAVDRFELTALTSPFEVEIVLATDTE